MRYQDIEFCSYLNDSSYEEDYYFIEELEEKSKIYVMNKRYSPQDILELYDFYFDRYNIYQSDNSFKVLEEVHKLKNHIIYLHQKSKKDFKVFCDLQSITMNDVVLNLI